MNAWRRKAAYVCAASVVVGWLASSVPSADAASSRTYFLTQTASCFGGTTWVITPSSRDGQNCASVPRILLQGRGIDTPNEDFALSSLSHTVRLAAGKIRGQFSVQVQSPDVNEGSAGNASPVQELPGLVDVVFQITLDGVGVGNVEVAGLSAPTRPATASFSLKVPKSLVGKSLTRADVTTVWRTCAGSVGCAVAVSGPHHSRFAVPVR